MNEVNPVIIALMFVLRCAVPLFIMLGISYLLKRLGWVKEPPPQPPNGETEQANNLNSEGEVLHGKV